jgi:ATP-dependent DNA helicase Q1
VERKNSHYEIQHTISKSMDGLLQESGRAGRDGDDSDCVLWWRPQDASRLSTMVCSEVNGLARRTLVVSSFRVFPKHTAELHWSTVTPVLEYALDVTTCRKLLFSRYFSESSTASFFGNDENTAVPVCGHCDNVRVTLLSFFYFSFG